MQEVHNQDTEHVHVIEDVAGTSSAQSQAQNLYYPELPPNTVIYGEYAKGYGQHIYCEHCSAWVGWYKFNHNSNSHKINEVADGSCPHHNSEIRNLLANHRV